MTEPTIDTIISELREALEREAAKSRGLVIPDGVLGELAVQYLPRLLRVLEADQRVIKILSDDIQSLHRDREELRERLAEREGGPGDD